MKTSKPKFIVVDVETTGLSPRKDKLHGIGLAWEEDIAAYYPIWDIPSEVRELLADPEVIKVAHNARFDIKFLLWNKFKFNGPWVCTQTMAHSLDENFSLSLENLSIRYLNEPQSFSWKRQYQEILKQAGVNNMAQLHKIDLLDPAHPWLPSISEYCCGDVLRTYKLYLVLKEKMKKSDRLMKDVLGVSKGIVDFFKEEVVPMERVILQMEMRGIRINQERINDVQKEFAGRRDHILERLNGTHAGRIKGIEDELFISAVESKITEKSKSKIKKRDSKSKTKFNWNSGDHVGRLLFESFKVPENLIVRTKSGAYSTSAGYLKELSKQFEINSEIVNIIASYLEYQKVKKIATTYTGDSKKGIVSKIDFTTQYPTIFTEYNQFQSTWRLNSKNPNCQNLPRSSPVKSFFRPHSDSAVILHVDADQIELRVAAHKSQDPTMIEIFRDGLDPHKSFAAQLYSVPYASITKEDPRRQTGKTCNFLLIFRGSWMRLQAELKKNGIDKSESECKLIIEGYFKLYKRYKTYLDEQLNFMRTYHRVVCETGAVRRLPEIIYGNYLNYYTKEFSGTPEMQERAREYCFEKKGYRDAFTGASLLYSHAQKQGYNFPIQHLAARIMKNAAVQLTKSGYKILNTVHDSFDIELETSAVKREMPKIVNILENCYPLSVPLKWEAKLLSSFDEKDRVILE